MLSTQKFWAEALDWTPRSSLIGKANFILQIPSQLVNRRCPLKNPEQFSYTNLHVCQINALIIKIVMQSEAYAFQSYPINRLSLGQGYPPPHIVAKY